MCTRIFWNDNPAAKVTGRTLDWVVDDEARLWHFPAGMRRTGRCDGGAEWEVLHRNVAMSFWNEGTTEGVNDAGLAAHLLYFAASEYERRDRRPGVAHLLWAQYVLDRFATVSDALAGLAAVQVVPVEVRGQMLGAHLAIEDVSGDSAIIEFIEGWPIVHHSTAYRVMANDPSFQEQLVGLRRYRPFGGDEVLPGDISSEHRFARANYFLDHLSTPTDTRQAVAGVLGVARNVSVPFGAPYDDFSVYPTWWASVTDLTGRGLYYQSTLAPNVVWTYLDGFAPDAGVLVIDPSDPDLSGDISARFAPADAPY